MKKLAVILVSLCLLVTVGPLSVFALPTYLDEWGPLIIEMTGYEVVVTGTDEEISQASGYENYLLNSTIYGEYTIVRIADNAFENYPSLESITIPETVKKIGKDAFSNCQKLDTVVVFNPDCEFVENSGFNSTQTFYGFKGSTTEALAKTIGAKFVDVKKMHDHRYEGKVCGEPTRCTICGAKGIRKFHSFFECYGTCLDCGEEVHKTVHAFYESVTPATLKKNGRIYRNCIFCNTEEKITKINRVKSVKLSATSYTYDGKVKKPTVTVKDSKGKKLKKGKNYFVSYEKGRKKIGSYKVTITLKGNYKGKKILTFKINPPKTRIPKITAGKKSLKVRISRKPKTSSGYQVQCSTSKTFKTARKVTVKNAKTPSLVIKGLKSQKTYYLRVRTYKTVNGKKYYSGWSAYKTKKSK